MTDIDTDQLKPVVLVINYGNINSSSYDLKLLFYILQQYVYNQYNYVTPHIENVTESKQP